MISIVLVLPVSSSIIDITRKEILEATPCMNEPPKPKCQMGAGDLKSQIFRDTFPRQLAPERDGVHRACLKEIVHRGLNLGKSGRSRTAHQVHCSTRLSVGMMLRLGTTAHLARDYEY